MKKSILVASVVLTLVSTQPLFAAQAVWIERLVKSDGFQGFGKTESASKEWIQSDRERVETNTEMKGKFLGALVKPQDSSQIIRLDKKVIWTLDDKKKLYVEGAIENLGVKTKKTDADKNKEGTGKPRSDIKSASVKVTHTGKKEKIGKFNTEEFEIISSVELLDLDTQNVTKVTIKENRWVTPDSAISAQVRKTMDDYNRAYAKALGLGQANNAKHDTSGLGQVAMFMGFDREKAAEKLAKAGKELAKVKGYPIRQETTWISEDSAATEEKKEDASPEPNTKVDVTSVGGFFGSLAQRAVEKKVTEKTTEKKKEISARPMMHITTEIHSIEIKETEESKFEIPNGYKKST